MRLSEAGLSSNIDYWKNVSERYRKQRDQALKEVERLQKILLEETGRAHDGNDWLREVKASGTTHKFRSRVKAFIGRFK